MRFRLPIHALSAFTILTMGLVGCGGKGGSTPPPTPPAISVVLSAQPPSSLAISATASITATVSNDSANAGVKWTVTCGGSACGSFSPTATASGAATVYTAPTTVPSPATVTVTATSVTDATKTASATITITGAVGPGVSVSLSPQPPTSQVVGMISSLTAVVANDSANAGVKWTVTCGGSACGSFNPTTTASAAATVYTAPTAIPTGGTVTVTATSVTDSTKSASATITIGPVVLADGTYVYNFAGQDTRISPYDSSKTVTAPYFVAGAFTVKNGAIIGGEQDFSDYSYGFSDLLVANGCSLSVAGGNIQIVLATANTQIGVNGVETLRGARVSSTRTLLSEFDTFSSASGSVDLQTGTAAPSGGYAFAASGVDGSNGVYSLNLGGVLNINGTTLSIGNSVFDYNDGGRFGQAQTFAAGTVSAPDAYGRVSFNLTPSTASGLPGIIFVGYILGPNRIQFVEDPSDGLGADLGGTALGQGSNTDNFNPAMLANTSYAYAASGADISGSTTIAGTFSFNTGGGMTGQMALNDLIHFTNTTIGTTATFTVDPTGRATITNVIPASLNSNNFTFQLYLDGNGNALMLGVDAQEVLAGPAYQQNAPPLDFEGSYALGATGVLNVTNYPSWSAAGPVTVSSDAITGATDYTVQSVTPYPAVALTGTESSSTGALSLAGLNPANFATAYNYAYFRIDSTRVFAIEIDGQSLGILALEGTH